MVLLMHNHTRLTTRRIKLLIAALAAEEASLIDNELWRYNYPTEKVARAEIEATYEWLYAQLDKRENKVA